MAERENDVDFTVPYYDLVGTTILMKKPDVEYSLFKFMQVLTLADSKTITPYRCLSGPCG